MIVNFTVGNFLSFKDKKTISFEAKNLKDLPENVVKHRGKKLLRSLVIYGANSSGKSNLLKAIGRMKDVLLNSVKLNPEEELDYTPFLLSTETEGKPTFFEIEFFIENILYRYGFEYNEKSIIKEWLFAKATIKGEEKPLFVREKQDIIITVDFKEGDGKEDSTNENRLFLSLVAQLGGLNPIKILGWFKFDLKFASGIEHEQYKNLSAHLISLGVDDINEFLFKPLNLGFKNIKVFKDDEEITQQNRSLFKDDNFSVHTSHIKYNNEGEAKEEIYKDFEEFESDGTKKIIHLSTPILEALMLQKSIIIDELDAKLHPILTQKIISLFNNPSDKEKNAQLLFATHDTNLLDSGLFRRDQIWFTEKDDVEQTDLYSLVDLKMPDGSKVRNDTNIEKNYIKGRYGAIPYINNIK